MGGWVDAVHHCAICDKFIEHKASVHTDIDMGSCAGAEVAAATETVAFDCCPICLLCSHRSCAAALAAHWRAWLESLIPPRFEMQSIIAKKACTLCLAWIRPGEGPAATRSDCMTVEAGAVAGRIASRSKHNNLELNELS